MVPQKVFFQLDSQTVITHRKQPWHFGSLQWQTVQDLERTIKHFERILPFEVRTSYTTITLVRVTFRHCDRKHKMKVHVFSCQGYHQSFKTYSIYRQSDHTWFLHNDMLDPLYCCGMGLCSCEGQYDGFCLSDVLRAYHTHRQNQMIALISVWELLAITKHPFFEPYLLLCILQ